MLFLLFLFSIFSFSNEGISLEGYMPVQAPRLSEITGFQHIPMADSEGIVLEVRKLLIPNVKDPYNPSFIKKSDGGYTIAFRQDRPWVEHQYKGAKIGLIDVDQNFQPIREPVFLKLEGKSVEDPRLFVFENRLYVSYCRMTAWSPPYECCIGLSLVDPSTFQVQQSWNLGFRRSPREKNWVPFTYQTSSLFFVYSLNPYILIRVKKPITGSVENPIPFNFSKKKNLDLWEQKWGKICGGTPPVLVDNEYVTFFHSRFLEKGHYWYVIGAMTFDKNPPFSLKRMSSSPLIFKGMYDTPMEFSRNLLVRVLFPSGCVVDQYDNREVFRVICGENDTGIKVLTLDKKRLFENMISVN